MKISEKSGWVGEYDIYINNEYHTTIQNRIVNSALNAMRDVLNGDITDLELKYIALGDSDEPISNNDTTLDNELFRKEFIQKTATSTGELQSTALILDDEATFHIKEIGIFAGANATSDTNSGIMISRILWDRDKSTELESIQFVRRDRIGRG